MRTWHDISEVPADLGRTVVTIGNFDGVHRGHQVVLRRAREVAAELGVETVVAVTFDPHPFAVLRPEHAPVTLSGIDARLRLAGAARRRRRAGGALQPGDRRRGRPRSSSTGCSSARCTPAPSWSAPTSASATRPRATSRCSRARARRRTSRSWACRWTAARRSGRRRTSAAAWPPVTSRAPRRRSVGPSPSPGVWSRATGAGASSATRRPTCPSGRSRPRPTGSTPAG